MAGFGGGDGKKASHLTSVFLLLLFWVGNVGLNVYNKWLFGRGGFKVPLFVTISHQIFCFVGAALLLLTPIYTRKPIESGEIFMKLLTISVFFSLNTGLNNTSLLYLTLSANQIIRALLPAVCAVFATFIEGKRYTWLQWSTMFVLVIGVVLALLDNPTFDKVGTMLCLSSVIGAALHVSVVAYFMGGKMGMSAFDVLLYTSLPIVVILLPPMIVSGEPEKLSKFAEQSGLARAVFLVGVGGVIAFLYNLIHYFFIHYTSSVYTTVAGNMKVALVVAFSFIFLDDDATALNIIGLGIACLAFFANSFLEFQGKEKEKTPREETSGKEHQPDDIKAEDKAVLANYDKQVDESQPLIPKRSVVAT
eukprot:c6277_g1_i1.p1 GENE.c6277_g1_i1~~c6277_g1_i1.p1  ORF type:complete len:363 (+),score=87.66 c6277_g1_i1:60-1148(+)